MNISEKLNRIEFLFHQIKLFNKDECESELSSHLEELILVMSNKFNDEAKHIRGELLVFSEKFDITFFASIIILFTKHINTLVPGNIGDSYRLESCDYDVDSTNTKLKEIMEQNLKRSNRLRLFDYRINYDLNDDDKKALLFHSINLFQETAKNMVIDDGDIMVMYFYAALIKQLSKDLNTIDHFYFVIGIMLDRFTQSQYFQIARDLAEEATIISENDNVLYWGYFLQFKVFNSQYIANEASLYLLSCLFSLRKNIVSKEFYEDFLINTHRYFRNFGLIQFAKDIYKTIVAIPFLGQNQLESITCSHFNLLIGNQEKDLILQLYDFLNGHRESIITNGKLSAIPWLNLIYNCYHVFDGDPNYILLKDYQNEFESIVGKKEADRLKAFALGDSDRIVEYFIESLVAHEETRDKNDLVGEIRNSLVLANKLITYSHKQNDPNAFLLAMILKSDYSLTFLEKEVTTPLREIRTIKKDEDKISFYKNYLVVVKEILSKFPDELFIWLASTDQHVFSLVYEKGKFQKIETLEKYTLAAQRKWINEKIDLLSFDDTIRVSGQIFPYLEEDQLKDLTAVTDSLSFSKIDFDYNKNVCLFRDIELSELPHNLLQNKNNKFILQNNCIIDTISVDLLEEITGNIDLPKTPSLSMWIPLDDGDFVLNNLYSKLEETIAQFEIETIISSLPAQPIESNVVILIAHGDKSISGFPSFYTFSNKAITNIHKVISRADILVLFICHSGSSEKATLRSQLNSFVRKLLKNGIKTIIAPYWALHISVPPIWLPFFLNSLISGENVGSSFRSANLKVFENNKNPGAWCCLHCYGNPNIKLTQ